ncbi:MAG: DUF815 domain-containing protein, partial [Nitrososphaeraceae archaeon]
TTFYTWNNGTKEVQIPILQEHNISKLVNDILRLNEKANLVTILLSGKSSSGKSTLTQTLCHRLSCKQDRKYIIKWFKGKDLHRLDEIVESLGKNSGNYILILDDVSFVLDQAKPNLRKQIAERLTTIRHDLGENSKVILFMNIHYGKAILPAFRDSYFRILTSMSDEDSKNWCEAFGWNNQYKISKFQKQFSSQMQEGTFFVNLSNKTYKYETDRPFRIALASTMSGVSPLLYPKEGCEICAERAASTKPKIDPKTFLEKFKGTYHNRAIPALQYWAYFVKGKTDALPQEKRHAVNFMTKLFSENDVNVDELIKLATQEIKNQGRKHFQYKKKHQELEQEIIKPTMEINTIE